MPRDPMDATRKKQTMYRNGRDPRIKERYDRKARNMEARFQEERPRKPEGTRRPVRVTWEDTCVIGENSDPQKVGTSLATLISKWGEAEAKGWGGRTAQVAVQAGIAAEALLRRWHKSADQYELVMVPEIDVRVTPRMFVNETKLRVFYRMVEKADKTAEPAQMQASAKKTYGKLGGAIAGRMQDHEQVELTSIGPIAATEAVHSVALAGVFMWQNYQLEPHQRLAMTATEVVQAPEGGLAAVAAAAAAKEQEEEDDSEEDDDDFDEEEEEEEQDQSFLTTEQRLSLRVVDWTFPATPASTYGDED